MHGNQPGDRIICINPAAQGTVGREANHARQPVKHRSAMTEKTLAF